MSEHKMVIIPQSVLDKHHGKVLTHKELDLLCHKNRIDFTIEYLYKKISIEKIADKYKMDKNNVDFIVSSFSEIVNKYIININNLINLQSVDIKFPIEIKLKLIIECVDNLVPAKILSNKYDIPISNIYKWVSLFKENNKNKSNFNSEEPSFIKHNRHDFGGHDTVKHHSHEKEEQNNTKNHINQKHKSVKKRLSRQEKLVILKEYFNSDLNMDELSKKFNTSILNIIRWRDEYLSDKRNSIFIEKMKIIAKNYFDGKLDKRYLKEKYAIKEEKIFEWSKKFNLLKNKNDDTDIKQKLKYDADMRNKIVDEYMNSNLTMKEIAKKYNVKVNDISNWKQSKDYKKYSNKNNNEDTPEFKNKNMNKNSDVENQNLDTIKELERQKIKNELLLDILKDVYRGNIKKSS